MLSALIDCLRAANSPSQHGMAAARTWLPQVLGAQEGLLGLLEGEAVTAAEVHQQPPREQQRAREHSRVLLEEPLGERHAC